MGKITESIFKADNRVIPLADVGYINESDATDHYQINIIMKFSNFDRDLQCMDPMISLREDEAREFMEAWTQYRHEVDGPFKEAQKARKTLVKKRKRWELERECEENSRNIPFDVRDSYEAQGKALQRRCKKMEVNWPKNKRTGEILYHLQQASISLGWVVQNLQYEVEKEPTTPPEEHKEKIIRQIETVLNKTIEEIEGV